MEGCGEAKELYDNFQNGIGDRIENWNESRKEDNDFPFTIKLGKCNRAITMTISIGYGTDITNWFVFPIPSVVIKLYIIHI